MKSLDNCSLTLVGDGDERDTIEAYIKKEGLEQRVFITGFTKEAYEYIKGCDIYASASQIEGLPFNIMEAMYLNKPIVASRIKGHTDLLPSTALFTPGNISEYVSLIRNNIQKREEEWDVDKYRLENVLKENMKIYLSVENKINREEKE
jgi:glycosyltransferase EpsD